MWRGSGYVLLIFIRKRHGNESEIATRLIRAAANVLEPTPEERTLSSLISQTRMSFRRNCVDNKRGRKRKSSFHKKVTLLKLAHADFYPTTAELKFLKERGLGESELPLTVFRNSTLDDIKESIIRLYPPHIQQLLDMCGFRLYRLGKSKKITIIPDTEITTGDDLENKLQQNRLVILPANDFPCDLQIIGRNAPRQQTTWQSSNATQVISEDDDFEPTTHSFSRRIPIRRNETRAISDDDEFEPTTPSSSRRTPIRRNAALSLVPETHTNSQRIIEEHDEDNSNDGYETEESDNRQNSNTQSCFLTFPSLPENAELENIEVSRSNCFNDVMKFYEDEDIVNKKIIVVFTGEIGVDGGGLTKELFSIFFQKCENVFFKGEDCLVPFLDLNKVHEIDKFIIVGRVLQHMLILTNKLPSKLSRA
ncbi:unnamed protein product [Brassicogethes aeneus]|uniref:HECT domain-containing protein n=1 Tax=Brassicogethes aeneus TaxID=1431903 RepID=A0A9P0BEV1_BRAAE|nr:unnamed protein product [Brassicogethes aeneus]